MQTRYQPINVRAFSHFKLRVSLTCLNFIPQPKGEIIITSMKVQFCHLELRFSVYLSKVYSTSWGCLLSCLKLIFSVIQMELLQCKWNDQPSKCGCNFSHFKMRFLHHVKKIFSLLGTRKIDILSKMKLNFQSVIFTPSSWDDFIT